MGRGWPGSHEFSGGCWWPSRSARARGQSFPFGNQRTGWRRVRAGCHDSMSSSRVWCYLVSLARARMFWGTARSVCARPDRRFGCDPARLWRLRCSPLLCAHMLSGVCGRATNHLDVCLAASASTPWRHRACQPLGERAAAPRCGSITVRGAVAQHPGFRRCAAFRSVTVGTCRQRLAALQTVLSVSVYPLATLVDRRTSSAPIGQN